MELFVASEELNNTADQAHESSYLRLRDAGADDPRGKALSRVAEYLRALGLSCRLRLATLAEEIVSAAEAEGRGSPGDCVKDAQQRVSAFRRDVFGENEAQVDPLWFRSFIATHPDAFLSDARAAQELSARFGDPWQGRPPAHQHFREQALGRVAFPRWALGLLPALALSGGGGALLGRALAADGLSVLEGLWVALFAGLSLLASMGMTAAVLGFLAGRRAADVRPSSLARGTARFDADAPGNPGSALPRSALLLPIYHESAEHVFAAVAAMRESLQRTPGGDAFEIFVLSDSRDPAAAAEEERAYRRVVALSDGGVPVYYRRRSKNERQKAGNLAEFFERFGHRYVYAVILDADSLMRGDTVVEMLRRMEASPRLALLQAPLALHRGATLFARAQQFVASVCGPMFTRGLALWSGPQGNYYGHNAVVRVRAFLECCALPVLSGEPPLGGHILSHDFVEAALLCRAGWDVRIAHDLEGSWEELPATLPDYIARDRRWCQGNLQHLRIALADGLRPMSRVHMLVGAAQYMAGPAWLAFVLIGAQLGARGDGSGVAGELALLLTSVTLLVLLLPRGLGLLETLRDPVRRRQHGGALRLITGVGVEAMLSLLIAPLLMLHHARIIGSILAGRAVRWGAQARRARGQLASVVRSEALTMLAGGVMLGALCAARPDLLPWLAPIWVPWLCAIPIALLASTELLGSLLRRLGIWTVASESEPDELLLRSEDLRTLTMGDACARFRDLVLDPVLNQAHVARLAQRVPAQGAAREELERLCSKALRGGPSALSAAERELLAGDAHSMRVLHYEAWQCWPVESFQLARDEPQLPLERLSLPQIA
jgi:membrane glycosyltransferase